MAEERSCVNCRVLQKMMELVPSYNFRDAKDKPMMELKRQCGTCINHSDKIKLRILNILLFRRMSFNWQPREG